MTDLTEQEVAAARAVLDRDIDPIIEGESFFIRNAAKGIINDDLRNRIVRDIVAAVDAVRDAQEGR